MLEIALNHSFGSFAIDLAFQAPSGVTALFGRSGSGKTTVINAVAGLLRPQAGLIRVQGRTLFDARQGINLPPHRRKLGYVFQDARLFPHLTVAQNLRYAQFFAGRRGAPIEGVVQMLGLEALLQRRPALLSGGEKQRVAIGRALLSDPAALLLDEPLAALDEARKAEILPYLETLRDQAGLPILYVSHSLAEVARLATTLVVIEAGRILRAGPLQELLSDPAAAPHLGLREAGALLSARVAGHDSDGLTELHSAVGPLWLPRLAAAPGAAVRLRIAAQDVMLARSRPEGISALNILPVVVAAVHLGEGPGALVQLRAGDELLLARVTRRSVEGLQIAPGLALFAVLKSVAVAQSEIGIH